ncbi:MAG: hypothetical protein B6I20_07625 [Bacteroidetes bacterium 4572_117]|nr:MAG: hypothetical protein B6I20_07625 [Bacteroidetes bacterium 4572_117]
MKKKPLYTKTILIAIIVFAGLSVIASIYLYGIIYSNNILLKDKEVFYLYIPSNAKLNDVTDSLSKNKILKDTESFLWVADKKKYKKPKAGRYEIKANMTNNDLINMLRVGNQKPVKLTFNNIRTIQELALKVSQKLEVDSITLVELLSDKQFLKTYKFSSNTVISMFIPNTYEFYWNVSAKAFFKKMNNEYEKFWTKKRLQKAKNMNMTQLEISTLASIVQAEQSMHNNEKARVAGLYINRLNKGMLLQSDPTVVYAIGDFSIRRVLNRDKEIDSPYNTYKYSGLPPAPINLPEISSIDAVLNYETHGYIFMCAKEDFSGYHNFSRTTAQHMIFARRYQRALNKKKIYR